jgi:alkylation response protein AidB-like acyl-CoA dehydrogenase
MSIIAIADIAPKPSFSDLMAAAKKIASAARDLAVRAEADRQVSRDVMERARDAGLFRIMQPEIYGGYEYGFKEMVDIAAAVGSGCGSTGWVCALGIVHQWLVACFPEQAQGEYWSNRDAIAFGSYAPVGKAVVSDGGYRLSGTWSFTSGCDYAQWLVLGGVIPPGTENNAAPRPAFFLVPIGDVSLDDNWFTMGLGATGSKNTVANNVFVPTHRVVPIVNLLTGTAPGIEVHSNPLYRQSMLSALPFALVAPILGMAEGALNNFLDMAKVRTTRGAVAGGNSRMAEFATIQSRVAEATGSVDAARLIIAQALDRALVAAQTGTQVDLELRIRNRLSQAFAVRLLVAAIDALFQAAGGQGIFIEKPIQRAWRDAHAGAVHVSLTWDAVSTMYGQYALGLEPKGQF